MEFSGRTLQSFRSLQLRSVERVIPVWHPTGSAAPPSSVFSDFRGGGCEPSSAEVVCHAGSGACPFRALIRKRLLNTGVRFYVALSDFGLSVYSVIGKTEVTPQGTGIWLRSKGMPTPNYSEPLLYTRCAGETIYRLFGFDREKEVGGSFAHRYVWSGEVCWVVGRHIVNDEAVYH